MVTYPLARTANMNKNTLYHLLRKQREGALTPYEQHKLEAWEAELEKKKGLLELCSDAEQQEVKERLWEKIHRETAATGKLVYIPVHQKPDSLSKISWIKYAVAAILVVFAGGAYIWFNNNTSGATKPAGIQHASTAEVEAPASNLATITLSNGQKITLDGIGEGMLAVQDNVNIRLDDGHVVYSATTANIPMEYNVLTVPRGSRIASIVLSDGTKVYLNSASSLKYPVAFTGKERRVEITGEAYFEVARDPSRKFIVTGRGITTEVLGTHFNVNTYPDEDAGRVTLLEGSVKVSGDHSSVTINVGDQAAVRNGDIQLRHAVDIEQVMAWKNGVFNFNNRDCESVMRQLARWYDIEVEYPNGVPKIMFGGEIQKTLPLSEMMEALGAVEVKFEIAGKKLIVLP